MYRGGTAAIAERANTKMEMTEAENFELDIISEFVSIWGFEKWYILSQSENPYYFLWPVDEFDRFADLSTFAKIDNWP